MRTKDLFYILESKSLAKSFHQFCATDEAIYIERLTSNGSERFRLKLEPCTDAEFDEAWGVASLWDKDKPV